MSAVSVMMTNDEFEDYRLPTNTKPISYELKLATNIGEGKFNFTGIVTINLQVLENDATKITLHARQLKIDYIHVYSKQSSDFILINSTFHQNKTTDFLIIGLAEPIQPNGSYYLKIKYYGELQDEIAGFYKSSYVNSKGETK